MALPPNTNIDAMVSQAALTISGQKKSIAIQRLGTGFRINSAKDDAAGLAISNGMVSQVSGLTQARRNANDGISLAQTTEGALAGTTAQLQRMRELIVAAQNPEQSQNLAAIQEEISQLTAEINHTSTETSLNNTAAALNLVQDADYAAETAAFASASVLQQAGVAVLAEANQQPQQLLNLLPK
jgi:flagellin